MSAADEQQPPAVVGFEREVLEQVWACGGDTSVREVLDALNGRDDKQRAYTTLMTVLVRLHAKGLLVRRRDGRSDRYSAALTREQYHAIRARAEVDALVGEYGDAALVHFARQVGELDPERRARLERLAGRRDDA
ncbi:BlaI/MecI/CopY family transcriptional regulator [Conexibacter sp. CPCC 206217]|uniref:BlaI/MecI/CopY family transcriptional regulator n=1 Tax=Conexibacter sp. CPCC 206217 TaxID=3064574 RepID=UPI002725981A|nr:BlaI/MecI/CopY family transcriptional regulator [Conexibacter sp. CPCC 206217]MDO8209524.1 BlaI/MecI/CopY family transcriptional regulator [Conexibacter sp. CPCC 206217]